MNKKNILVVDDEIVTRKKVSKILDNAGYKAEVAVDGKDGLKEIIDANNTPDQFDLLITDINMPVLDGIELLDELRKLDLNIPAIAFTGNEDKKIVIELLRRGCSDYLAKPFDKKELIQRVELALDKQSLRESKEELDVKNRIDEVFIKHGTDEIDSLLNKFLEITMNTLKSSYGIFGYYEPKGDRKSVAIDKSLTTKSMLNEKEILIPQDVWEGIGEQTISEKRAIISNNPDNSSGLNFRKTRFISCPVIHDSFSGYIITADKEIGYNLKDQNMIKAISSDIAPILDIKLKNDIFEKYRNMAEKRIWESNNELIEKQKEIEIANKKLEALNNELQLDQELAENVFANILNTIPTGSVGINYYLTPMKKVGGDLFLSTPVFINRQYVFLGDFTGHGLSAAIGAIPVSEIFNEIKDNSHSIGDISRKINRQLKALLPTGLFLCACLIELDYTSDKIHVWNGGLPDLIIRGKGGRKKRISSKHLPMGILSDDKFDSSVEVVRIDDGDYIYIFTDGVTEAENKEGVMFGQERIEEHMAHDRPSGSIIDEIKRSIDSFCSGVDQSDDISLVEIRYSSMDVKDSGRQIFIDSSEITKDWHVGWRLGPEILKSCAPPYTDILKFFIEPYDQLREKSGELLLILAELFTNAFEHGVLGLDAGLKKEVSTMERYFVQREEAIANLEQGWIKIDIELNREDQRGNIILRVEDSGPGFDYSEELPELSDNITPSGRGIPLLLSLCKEVKYMGRGNKVQAVYSWEE